MALYPKILWKSIKWKQLGKIEITSSWKPGLQAAVLLYIAEMLQEGFQLIEIFEFLKIIFPKQAETFVTMTEGLSNGQYFHQVVHHMHIKGNITYQIQVAEAYGNFGQGLEVIAKYIHETDLQTKKIRSVMIYPIILICLMISMMFGMRAFLLPQLATMSLDGGGKLMTSLIWFLENLPNIFTGLLLFLFALAIIFIIWKKRTNPLDQAKLFVKLPIIGSLFCLYYTQFFAYEFSQLFKIGYSIKQITESFKHQDQVPFLHAFGVYLEEQYLMGIPFAVSLADVGIFSKEFPAIVIQGELLNQLAIKTRLYSQRSLKRLFEDIARKIKITQSVLFFLVALSVVSVYLMLMLPMLTMLETI